MMIVLQSPFLCLFLIAVALFSTLNTTTALSSATSTQDTPNGITFDGMVDKLSLPSTTIQFIDSPEDRKLLTGVAAAVADPVILGALRIAYEDLGPIRAAGDDLFVKCLPIAVASERAASAATVSSGVVTSVLEELARFAASPTKATRNLFCMLDGDMSGTLSRQELLEWPPVLDLVRDKEGGETYEETADRFMANADDDSNGEISFVEFVNAVAREPKLKTALSEYSEMTNSNDNNSNSNTIEKSRRLFDCLDENGSGDLDESELLASKELLAFIKQNEDESDQAAVSRFMDQVDKNKDGSISFVEFALAATMEQPVLQIVDDVLTAALQSRQDAFENSVTGSFLEKRSRRKRRGLGSFLRRSPEERFDRMLAECLEWEMRLYSCSGGGSIVSAAMTSEAEIATNEQQECEEEECPIFYDDDDDDEQEEECIILYDDDDKEDRLSQVLQGAFAGVHCAPVMDALRACYLDSSPLRLGGDLLFKVLRRSVVDTTTAAVKVATQQRQQQTQS